MALEDLFGSPDYLKQLIGEEQYGKAQNTAFNQGLINAGLAALAGSSQTNKLGQILASAGQEGMKSYQGSMDRTLADIAKGMQMQELVRKQKEAQQIKDVLASAVKPQYTYGAGEQGPTRDLTGMTYDMKSVIPTLQALGRFDLIKDIGESQKTLRQSGIMSEGQPAPSPFSPYLQATNPAVRQLAQQLESGFNRGIIDEETAYKRIEPLAKMEESYVARVDKQSEGKKPTEGERNAAGFAQRMEFSEAKIKELENKYAEDMATKGSKAEVPYPTVGMSIAGSLPFVGGYARSKAASDEQALYRQAQENWVRANLRKESGAAIGADEMDREIATYFPTAGELSNPRIIAQKSEARQVTMDAMRKASGNAYEPFNMSKFMKDNGLEGRK